MHPEQDMSLSCRCRVYLHGSLEVWKLEASDTWKLVEKGAWGKGKPARAVFKRLLATPGRRLSRGKIQDDLWPNLDFELADSYLYNAISLIHRIVGRELVKTWESAYELAGQDFIWTDIDACEQLLKEAENRGYVSGHALPLLERALSYLERGELLEGEDGIWVYGLRKKSEDLLRQCRLWLAESYETQGKLLQAGLQYRALLQTVPPDEDALQCWMSMLHRQNKTQEARKCYQDVKGFVETQGYTLSKSLEQLIECLPDELSQVSSSFTPTLVASLIQTPGIYRPSQKLDEGVDTSSMQQNTVLHTRIPDCPTRFGLALAQTITLIEHWYGMALFCHHLQDQLDRNIKSLDILKTQYSLETFTLSRRSFLITLAALPAASLASSRQAHKTVLKLEEFLPQCAASITGCWHLSGGSNLDAIAPLIDSYLPTLLTLMKTVSSYREGIADLVAQCYFLKTILAWHVEGLAVAEAHCRQALHYSDIAKNPNLKVTALNQHALIAYYAKEFSKALSKSEEADALLQKSSHEQVFPIVQGRVSMYLAAIQAQQSSGNAKQTLEHAQQAFALQATAAEPVPLYADCGNAPLTLWDGLTHYHLNSREPRHTEHALTSLKTFGHLQPSMNIPERFRLECLNNRILAAVQCNEMEEAIVCFEAGRQGARVLESKQRKREVEYAYREMLRRWPGEERVQALNVTPESMQ